MNKYECTVCGYVYDPEKGVPEMGILPGTPFAELPEDFICPLCGAEKSEFVSKEAKPAPSASETSQIFATIEQIIPRTPSVKSFRLAVPRRAAFKSGQYLTIRLQGEEDLTRCLSISSSPTEQGYVEVTKRITQSRFSQILDQAEPGLQAEISYPMGKCTFEGEFEKIALLSGGIGITPLRSICKYVVDNKLSTSVCLIYSNRTADEIAFRSEFDAMQRDCPSLKVVYTLSRAGNDWTGRTGRIDADLIRGELPDHLERCFYVCGPPQMVDAMSAMLRSDLHIPEPQVRTENFIGY